MKPARDERKKRTTAWVLTGIVVLMFGFGFAIAPLYSLLCKLTGLQSIQSSVPGSARVETDSTAAEARAASRTVTVRFDTNVTSGLPWEFVSLVRRLEVKPGEAVEVKFRVRNLADRAYTGRAIANVVPIEAAQYFTKTECFCFQDQPLAAGETKEMAVRFLVSPLLPDSLEPLTLSYTFMKRSASAAQPSPSTAVEHASS